MDAPPSSFLRALGELLSTTSPSTRLSHTEDLTSQLPSINASQAPLTASITTQAISQLFTKDRLSSSTERWSRHPSYNEPLLEALLTLLCNTLAQPPQPNPPASPSGTIELNHSLAKLKIASRPYTLYPPPFADLTIICEAFADASRPLTLATAHLLHLLTTLSQEPSTKIARLSFHTLAALARVQLPETCAAFLPGLVSSLSKSLFQAVHFHSTVCIAALDALHVILSTLRLPPSSSDQQNYETPALPPSLEQSRSFYPQKNKPRLSVTRDKEWIAAAVGETATRLSYILASSSGPLHHSSPRAREYLAYFLFECLHGPALSDLPCRILIRVALVSLAGDDFPSVRTASLHVLRRLLCESDISLNGLERGIRTTVSQKGYQLRRWGDPDNGGERAKELKETLEYEDVSMKRLMASGDSIWSRVAGGYLNIVVPPYEKTDSPVIPTEKLSSTISLIGADAFCRMLTQLLSEQWEVAEDSPESFVKALDCVVLRAGALLGREGLLTSVFAPLIRTAHLEELGDTDDGHLNAFRERGYAVLLLQAVLRGEIGREDARESKMHQKLVYECTKETLQVMNGFFLPTIDILRFGRVDDDMISLKHCLLICTGRIVEDLADLHQDAKLRPLGADMTLVLLMSFLRDVSNGEVAVRKTARETLTKISKVVVGKSERRLLFRHLNYIIARVIRNLDKRWAGDILDFVIGNRGDDVSREATVLLESTLQRMNESLAGASDERALATMNSIINVLSTAVAQKPVAKQIPGIEYRGAKLMAGEETAYHNDLSDLRRSLFVHCTEEIPNYEELIARVEVSGNSYFENDDSDDESHHGAFETIATHVLEGTRDILVGRPWNVRAASLFCATLSVKLLEGRHRKLLPFAATILPLLPDQFLVLSEQLTSGQQQLRDFRLRKFGGMESGENVEELVAFLNSKGQEVPVVTNACLLLSAFAAYAGSFIRDRFVRLIYPKMRPLLRLAKRFPTLLVPTHRPSTGMLTLPSYGAMSACDACLEAIASVSIVAPGVLAPFASSLVEYLSVFFDPKFDPATSPKRQVVHTNRSMVRFECERWVKRSEFAETIVRQLKTVNPSDVLTSLLKHDRTAPKHVSPAHDSLHVVTLRSIV